MSQTCAAAPAGTLLSGDTFECQVESGSLSERQQGKGELTAVWQAVIRTPRCHTDKAKGGKRTVLLPSLAMPSGPT